MRATNTAKQIKINLAAAACCTILALGAAPVAAVDLNISGLIKPGACTPTLGGAAASGEIVIPTVTASNLNQDKSTQIDSTDFNVTVDCPDGPMRTALRFKDTASEPLTANRFSIGLDAEGTQIGATYIQASHSSTNQISYVTNPAGSRAWARMARASTGTPGSGIWLNQNAQIDVLQTNSYAIGSLGGVDAVVNPLSTTNARYDLRMRTFVNRADSLRLADDVAIEGSISIDVEYI